MVGSRRAVAKPFRPEGGRRSIESSEGNGLNSGRTPSEEPSEGSPATGLRRKKDPRAARAQLLQAAARLAAEKGLHAVTLEKVAELAGLTKGALQYHFKSRKGLVEALYDQVIGQLQQRMEGHRKADAGEPEGASARAYLKGAEDDTQGKGRVDVLRVLTAHSLSDATVRHRYLPVLREWMQPDDLPLAWSARTMICRLAADGLWISRLIGYDDVVSEELMAEIRRQLERLTTQQGIVGGEQPV